jgi:hypothetical protein
MQLKRLARRWPGPLIVLMLAGCGPFGEASVYPVKGKVTFEGKPLVGGGSIAFVPLTPPTGRPAGGVIAEDGTYQLTTRRQGDGATAGEFRVVITQQTVKEPEAAADGQDPIKPSSIPMADRIPAAFSDHAQSPVKATVEPKSPNEINIDLKRSEAPPPFGPPGAMANPPRSDPFAPAALPRRG